MFSKLSITGRTNRRKQRTQRRRLTLEALEPRSLMATNPLGTAAMSAPLPPGVGGQQVYQENLPVPAMESIAAPSRNAQTKTIYLDFDGHTETLYNRTILGPFGPDNGLRTVTARFSTDGDRSRLNSSDVAAIREIWARVAEDFAPFNVNVTTIDPGRFSAGKSVRVAIGGADSDWYGKAAAGVQLSISTTIVFVFSESIRANVGQFYIPHEVANTASHEVGHAFGLLHQAQYPPNGPVDEYYNGDGLRLPIMGSGDPWLRSIWWHGTRWDGDSPSTIRYQDDMALLGQKMGYRADDYGGSTVYATQLKPIRTSLPRPVAPNSSGTTGLSTTVLSPNHEIRASGIIERTSDADYFWFRHAGGAVKLRVDVNSTGPNLNARLELRDSNNALVAASVSGDAANYETLWADIPARYLAAGTYYVVVRSEGRYGDVGQYTLTGNGITVAQVVSTSPPVSAPRVAPAAGIPSASREVSLAPATRVASAPLAVNSKKPPTVRLVASSAASSNKALVSVVPARTGPNNALALQAVDQVFSTNEDHFE